MSRKRGKATESEFTVVKTDAYNDINTYLSQLSESSVKSVEDVLAFNIQNAGTEGAQPRDVPAFPSGQVQPPQRIYGTSSLLMKQDDLHEVVKSRGIEDETYSKALQHIRYQCRDRGIDAALHPIDHSSGSPEFDALLLCDHKKAGQQLAAQAGMPIFASFDFKSKSWTDTLCRVPHHHHTYRYRHRRPSCQPLLPTHSLAGKDPHQMGKCRRGSHTRGPRLASDASIPEFPFEEHTDRSNTLTRAFTLPILCFGQIQLLSVQVIKSAPITVMGCRVNNCEIDQVKIE